MLLIDLTLVDVAQVWLISSYLNSGEFVSHFESLFQLLCVFHVHKINKVKLLHFLFIIKKQQCTRQLFLLRLSCCANLFNKCVQQMQAHLVVLNSVDPKCHFSSNFNIFHTTVFFYLPSCRLNMNHPGGNLHSCTNTGIVNSGQQDAGLHNTCIHPGQSSHPRHIAARPIVYVHTPTPPPPPPPSPFLHYQWPLPMPLFYNPLEGFPGTGES